MSTEFNLEAELQNQADRDGKVQNDAVVAAKEAIAKEIHEREVAEVKSRITNAECITNDALRDLRASRVKESAYKTYLTELTKAKEKFEADGNYVEFDTKCRELDEAKSKSIREGLKKVYGSSYWRYMD